MDQLEGRVAVVTGGGSGIGRGLAHAFAAAGMGVVVSDVDARAAGSVAAELRDGGREAIAIGTDVTDGGSIAALVAATLERFGAVHVLANNAGVMPVGPLAEARPEDWTWTFDVNLRGTVSCVQAFLPHLRANAPAHVLNTVSMSALAPRLTGQLGIYSASKAALLVYSEVLRTELESEGIGVSALCPGPVQTRIWESERNRPAAMGAAAPPALAPERAATGLDPLEVGRIAVEGIRRNAAFIFTNEGSRERIERRVARILGEL